MNTISIECVHCHKRYNAPAAMAGKKVKCKHCGKVFAIPAEAGAPAPAADSGRSRAGEAVAPAAGPAGKSMAGAKASGGSVAGGKLGQASAGYASRLARTDDVDEIELAGPSGGGASLRPSVIPDFPGAVVLDQLGPILLTVLGLGFLAIMAFKSNDKGPAWVSAVRLAAYLVLALGVAFPLGLVAMKHGARKCRFALPPQPALRTLGTFALPFALSFICWLAAESTGMLVFGTVIGMVLLSLAVWFFFRVQPQEMGTTVGGAIAAYVGAIVISVGVLFGVHKIFATMAASSGTNQLAMSPMGPFEWDVPVVDLTPKVKPRPKPVIPDAAPTTTPVDNTGTGTLTATRPTTDAVASTTKPLDPNAVALANTNNTNPTTTTPSTSIGTVPQNPPTTTPPETTPGSTKIIPAAPAHSEFVLKMEPLADLADYNQVVFSSGTGTVVAALKTGPVEETVEFFAGNPLAKRGEATFPTEKDVKQTYVLNGTGDQLARIVAWPKLAVQLWNTATNKEKDSKLVPLNPQHGMPEILGFGFNDNIVLAWTGTNGGQDIEVVNPKTPNGQSVAYFVIDKFERASGNPSISPDGRTLALAAYALNQAHVMSGGIDLWNLTNTARKPVPIRTLDVPLKTWVKPTGMAYGPMGQRMAVLFESEGRGVLYTHRTTDPKVEHEFLFRSPPYPENTREGFNGKTLDWVDANTLLVMGRSLIDSETGKILGDLGIESPKAQRVVDKETILLQTQTAEGKNQIMQVKLNLPAIAAKRAELKAR